VVTTGKFLSLFGMLGFVVLAAIANPNILAEVNKNSALLSSANVLGALTAIALFAEWGLGIYHWGQRYAGARKSIWGAIVILGVFVGALIYWWFAAARAEKAVRVAKGN